MCYRHEPGGAKIFYLCGQGVVVANNQWAQFNGTKLHETQPFEGTRVSLIAFTHNACEELSEVLVRDLQAMGFTAGGSDRLRDDGDVDGAKPGRRPPWHPPCPLLPRVLS